MLKQSAKTKEKRQKNRKEENNLAPILFCVEILRLLVYCNMVFFAMHDAKKAQETFE